MKDARRGARDKSCNNWASISRGWRPACPARMEA